jgi:hypothetical protein
MLCRVLRHSETLGYFFCFHASFLLHTDPSYDQQVVLLKEFARLQDFKQLWEMPNMYTPQARPGGGLDNARRSNGDTAKLKQVRSHVWSFRKQQLFLLIRAPGGCAAA